MRKFKSGDRVIAIKPVGRKKVKDVIGRVILVGSTDCLVEFDRDIGGHDGLGDHRCDDGHGWFCGFSDIELVKPKFDIKDYKGKYVMHVTTEAQAELFCNYLHSIGKRWSDGEVYTDNTSYDEYEEGTCYAFNTGHFSPVGYYSRNGWTILEFDDFNWSDFEMKRFTKKDLKEFDVVKLRSGEVFMVMANDKANEGYAIFNEKHWGCYQYFESYNDDLTSKIGATPDDIVAVARCDRGGIYTHLNRFFNGETPYKWDWERKEIEEMTLEEVCKALGKEVKIVKEHK